MQNQQHFHHRKTLGVPISGAKPQLEMIRLPIFRVHYRKLEDYFCRIFHFDDFDFLGATGMRPGLIPEYVVTPTLPPSGDAQRQADTIRGGRRTHDIGLILNVLCLDGYIPAGKYLIDTKPEPPPLEAYKALLQKSGTPESEECRRFRAAHRHDKHFTRTAAQIDTRMLAVLKRMQK